MAFNIPKAWSPGLALPQYIRDEGLQRHAFTTLEAPDGTYDNPAVGDGGFVVPQYIMDEGYGQGAFITKYAPRGSYFGPKIPNWLNKPGGNTIKSTRPVKGGTQFTLKSMSGLGSLGGDSLATFRLPAEVSTNAKAVMATPVSSPVKTVAVLGALGIGGLLIYRHFKKKGG
jgi:hypothetical protein